MCLGHERGISISSSSRSLPHSTYELLSGDDHEPGIFSDRPTWARTSDAGQAVEPSDRTRTATEKPVLPSDVHKICTNVRTSRVRVIPVFFRRDGKFGFVEQTGEQQGAGALKFD